MRYGAKDWGGAGRGGEGREGCWDEEERRKETLVLKTEPGQSV